MATRRKIRRNGRQLSLPHTMSSAERAELERGIKFFRELSPDGRHQMPLNQAMKYAKAEIIAEHEGWTWRWASEVEDWSDFLPDDVDLDEVDSVEWCAIVDEDNEVLAAVGGHVILKSMTSRELRDYRRMTQAELALEAALEKGLL
jgi:hypothetical protein